MTQAETLYSAKQVASELKISSGMLRRYALAYEVITEQKIYQDARDGRQYTANQLAILQRAKAFVSSNPGMSVDHALRLAMGASEAEIVQSPSLGKGADAEALTTALERVTAPLLEEIRALRISNERLSAALGAKIPNQEGTEMERKLPSSESPSATIPNQNHQGSILVGLLRWLENRVQGKKS